METLIKSVRVEPVETQNSQIKGFDKLSPNGNYLFSVSLFLLCHKRRLAFCRPQQGHCPRRSIN
jgi:hypothetical protein